MAINPVTGLEEDDGAGGTGGGAAGIGAPEAGTGYAPGGAGTSNIFGIADQAVTPALSGVNRVVAGFQRMGIGGTPASADAMTKAIDMSGKPAESGPAPGGGAPIPPPPDIGAGAPGAPVVPPALGKPQLVKTGSETEVTGTRLTKEGQKLNSEVVKREGELETAQQHAANYDAEKALAARAGDIGVDKAKIEGVATQSEADLLAKKTADAAALAAEHNALIAKASTLAETEKARYQKMEMTDFWSDKSAGQKAGILLGIALGGIGAAISGDRRNQAMDTLNTMIQQDFAEKRAQIDLQHTKSIDAGVNEDHARAVKGAALVDLDTQYAGLMGRLKADTVAKLSARGADEATIARDAAVQNFARQEQQGLLAAKQHGISFLQQQMELQKQHVTTKTTSEMRQGGPGAGSNAFTSEVTGKPASDKEREADAFAERMSNQLQTLKKLDPISDQGRRIIKTYLAQQTLAERNPGANYAATMFGLNKTLESKLSPNDRAAFQAIREFTAANLRQESGAAIGASETEQAYQRYAPLIGEKEADRARKIKAMEDVATASGKSSYRPTFWQQQIKGGGAPAPGAGAAPAAKPQGRHGTHPQLGPGWFMPDGHFYPDNARTPAVAAS